MNDGRETDVCSASGGTARFGFSGDSGTGIVIVHHQISWADDVQVFADNDVTPRSILSLFSIDASVLQKNIAYHQRRLPQRKRLHDRFPEASEGIPEGAKALPRSLPEKRNSPGKVRPHGAFPSENTILMHVHATGRAGIPSESPIRFVNFAALELIQG